MNCTSVRVEVPRRVRGARQVQVRPLAHVVHEQLLVRVAHVRADDDEVGEVDQHVLEQLGVLHARPHPRPGMPTLIADRDPELLAHLVHGVVAWRRRSRPGVASGMTRTSAEARVLGELADAAHVPVGPRRIDARTPATRKRPGMRVGDLERLRGVAGRAPGVRMPVATPSSSITPSSCVDADARAAVAAEVAGDVRVLGLAEEVRRGLLASRGSPRCRGRPSRLTLVSAASAPHPDRSPMRSTRWRSRFRASSRASSTRKCARASIVDAKRWCATRCGACRRPTRPTRASSAKR